MRTHWARATALLVGFLLLIAACSSDDENPVATGETAMDQQDTTAGDSSQATGDDADAPAEPTSRPTPEPSPTPTPTPEPAEAVPLSSVIGAEASGEGWALAPGTWTSPFLATPVTFTTSENLTVFEEVPGVIGLGWPDFSWEVFDAFVLMHVTGMQTPPPDESSPPGSERVPDDLGAWLEQAVQIEVIGTGTSAGVPYYDITSSFDDPMGFPCQFGEHCVGLFEVPTIGGTTLGEGETHVFRVYELPRTADGELQIVWIRAHPDTFDAVVASAEAVIETLVYEGPAAETPGDSEGPVRLESIAGQPLLAGEYTASTLGHDIRLTLDQDYDDLIMVEVGFPDGLVLLSPERPNFGGPNSVIITQLIGFLTPEQARIMPTGPPPAENVLPADADITAHLEALPGVELRASGEATIGGQPARWWDIGPADVIPEDASFDCGRFGPPGVRCVEVLGTAIWGVMIEPTYAIRMYLLEDLDNLVIVLEGASKELEASALPLDVWVEQVQPILEGLTIN